MVWTMGTGLLVMGSGILATFAGVFYFKAITTEEVSKVIFYFQAQPLILLLLAYFILHETIRFNQIIGFLIILIAVVGVSIKFKKNTFKLSPGLINVLIANLLAVIGTIMIKAAINANSFASILSYESWDIALGGLLLVIFIPRIQKSFIKSLRELKKSTIAIVLLSGLIFVTGKIIVYYAYSRGPIALVSIIISTQVFYGIIFGLILTLIFPHIFKEDISKTSFVKKIICMVVLTLGIALMRI